MPSPDLPFELKLTLRSGTVYYFEHRGVYSTEPHFFAVINADPLSSNVLVQKLKNNNLRHHRDLPKDILEKIWKGVHSYTSFR
jgi:hypothetical protein